MQVGLSLVGLLRVKRSSNNPLSSDENDSATKQRSFRFSWYRSADHSLRRYELPLGCEILDLLELEDCGLAFANDCCCFALLWQQCHRPCYRRSQLHSAVIFRCNKLFRVDCHWYTPTLTAGLEASAHAPNAHSKSKPSVINACLPDASRVGFATRIALANGRCILAISVGSVWSDSLSGRV